MSKKVLFISHNASRSGAPLMLYNCIKWLKIRQLIDPYILLIDGGSLENDFSCLGPTFIWNGFHKTTNWLDRAVGFISLNQKKKRHILKLKKYLEVQGFKLVYSNSIVANKVAYELGKTISCPFLSHVHEMSFSANHFYKSFLLQEYIENFDHFISVSQQSLKLLTEELGVDESKITVIPPFYSDIVKLNSTIIIDKENIKIGFSGYAGWRKGIDLFTPLLAVCNNKFDLHNIEFIWIGEINEETKERILYDLKILNIVSKVSFPGYITNPHEYMALLDVFVLLSREDPFPIACLEAASNNVPLICFEASGGIPDLIEDDAGKVVPYLNLDLMAEAIKAFVNNKHKRIIKGEIAAKKVKSYSQEAIMPLINSVIQKITSN
ncbi:glycosyltransferase family 4 protein [Pontibacter sp. BT310]|uniref:Glycosyltransferase family 4 protein n=1 Tax=Pontibacter populi TaxID=890055 RepID=A0ABS6XF81_9BACT|nr:MULTISPECIES: glycosyltransferase family 4 protein [Pontibacter]MBJ6119796.1 glycosyltransferase family 4 protein [Pontibacter sp. BT310]MBR0572225.1 glycosyltransferase family 4 protein [Microvirga sp. STS03]MBW3366649.1 glycosyltransferase family 4 protein [Pontibacter populi]